VPPAEADLYVHTVGTNRVFIATVVTVWLTGSTITSAFAGGYDHGKATGACSFNPPTAAIRQPYAVTATGLPTNTEVDLFVLNYETGTREYQNLAVNPDGTWSGTFTQITVGKFKFEFVSASTGATRLASKDAVCTIAIY
jgi:hypothetical protein